MSDAIIVGILSLIGTLGGSLLGIISSNKLTNYRIKQLEIAVSKHNNLIDRMYNVESRVALIEEEIKECR